jgi:hypothetical protein
MSASALGAGVLGRFGRAPGAVAISVGIDCCACHARLGESAAHQTETPGDGRYVRLRHPPVDKHDGHT